MGLVGVIIVGFSHIPLYPISNGTRKYQSFSMIAIRNIPNQNHTSYQPQLLDPLTSIKKEPKKFLLPGVRDQLCQWVGKVRCRVLLPDAHIPRCGCLTHIVIVDCILILRQGGFRYDCVFHSLILSQNTFSGPAKGTPNIFNLILIFTITSLAILSVTISEPNVLD